MDRQRMYAGGEFARKYLVNHAVALDSALTAERLRHDMNPEMRLPARPMTGMAGVLVGFVHHIEALRCESRGQFVGNKALYLHGYCPWGRPAIAARSTVDASVPIPKFAPVYSTLRGELRNQRDTSKYMILVWLLDLKFLIEFAATVIGTSNLPH